MRELYAEKKQAFAQYQAQSVTPYLGLKARLSQVWINRWTILILLVLARTLIAIRDLNGDLASARREALSACTTVESMGSTMASMPHYMSEGVNDLTATSIEKAVNGLFHMTTMSITGVEEIVVFVINMMTSTYLCLITLVVSGALHAAISLLEDASKELQTLTKGLGDDLASVVSGFDSALNSAISGINSVFGAHIPTLNVDKEVQTLRNLQLPPGLDAELRKLNSSIPDFAQVQNFTNNAIRLPFELLKKEINSSLGTYTFDRSVFPVPAKEQLTFCDGNNGINDFFDKLGKLMVVARKVFIITLVIAAVLACIPMGYRELRRWRTQQQRAELVSNPIHSNDPLDVVYIVSRPYTSTFGIWTSSPLKSLRRQALMRWIVAYATTEAALFVLALGLAGLFTCACHAILLKSIQNTVPELADQVGAFADEVVNKLNNASQAWARDTNHVIITANTDINKNVFGWVNVSVNAINNTLNTFTRETTHVLNATFGGTILYEPVTEVFNCLIGLKIAGIEKALTWVEDHAHVSFPLLPNNTFTLGALASAAAKANGSTTAASTSFLANPSDEAGDKISSAIVRVTNKLYDEIRTEAIISSVILAIWLTVFLIGVVRASFLWFGSDENIEPVPVVGESIDNNNHGHAHAQNFSGPAGYVDGKLRGGHDSISAPMDFRSDNQDRLRQIDAYEPAPGYARDDPFGDDKAVEQRGVVYPATSKR